MQKLRCRIRDVPMITPTVIEVRLASIAGSKLSYAAGQYATLSFPSVERLRSNRPFSFVSAPTDNDVRFGIRIGGPFTRALSRLQPGDLAVVTGPFGRFTLDRATQAGIVLLVGGIGVTPFLSMVREATAR